MALLATRTIACLPTVEAYARKRCIDQGHSSSGNKSWLSVGCARSVDVVLRHCEMFESTWRTGVAARAPDSSPPLR